MRNTPLTLSLNELQILRESCTKTSLLTAYNQKKLYNELKEAKIVAPENLPSNVVSLNSKVLLWNIGKGQTFTIQIVPGTELDVSGFEVPSYDPLALALLGYPEGSMVEWEMPDGINRFKVLSVSKVLKDEVSEDEIESDLV